MENIVPVTADLVRELRLRGKKEEAEDLIKAFRENAEKEKKQLSKELLSREKKIIRTTKPKNMCRSGSCAEKRYLHHQFCRYHQEQSKQWHRDDHLVRDQMGLCRQCNQWAEPNKKRCAQHLLKQRIAQRIAYQKWRIKHED